MFCSSGSRLRFAVKWSGVNFNNKFSCDHWGKLQRKQQQHSSHAIFQNLLLRETLAIRCRMRMVNGAQQSGGASLGQLGSPCVSRHKLKANEATITSTNTHKRGSNLQLNYDEMGNRKGINCPRNAIMLCSRPPPFFFFRLLLAANWMSE